MAINLNQRVLSSLLMILAGCGQSGIAPPMKPAPVKKDPFSAPCLVDISAQSNLTFVHDTGPADRYSMPQIMGSGAALFDFDNDNDLDILILSGANQAAGINAGGSRLYRQDFDGRFTDVTEKSGIAAIVNEEYAMGVAAGDVDNDGDIDLYLTRYGDDRLYLNQDGQFVDRTEEAGIANPQWATAASFFDYDRDGWLDLFVANYVDYFPSSVCEDGSGRRDFCGPESLSGSVDKLYRNLGASSNGTGPKFEDVTVSSGIARRIGKGLGVLCRDFDGDGRSDIFVANDGEENFLWVQHDNGQFSNEALLRGVGLNRLGEAEANMGVVAEDFSGDGWCDLFVTHLREEANTLYHGAQFGQFTDQTVASGFAVTSLPFTGFGVTASDFDNDGDLDLAIANGGVKRGPATDSNDVKEFWRPYAQRNEFYLNDGRGKFESQMELGGSDFARRVEVSRAIASGDVDNDGDIDLLVTNCAGPARLYRNDFPKRGNWLMVTAFDPHLGRIAIGAQIQVRAGKNAINREVNPSSGYLSSNDMRVHYGLGENSHYDSIFVLWPSGSMEVEQFPGGPTNTSVRIVRGSGKIIQGSAP